MTPRATLRLQFHKGFTFADAEALVPYFAALGVSHLYASPITTARAGSLHGYDVTDPTQVEPGTGRRAGAEAAGRRAAPREARPDRRHRAQPHGRHAGEPVVGRRAAERPGQPLRPLLRRRLGLRQGLPPLAGQTRRRRHGERDRRPQTAEARRLSPRLVAHRRRPHQLAALLRHQRARLPAHGGRRGVRGRACDDRAPLCRGHDRRRAGRSHRRPRRSGRLLPQAAPAARSDEPRPALSRGREDPAARRDAAGRLGLRRHHRLRLHGRSERAAARPGRRAGAGQGLGSAQRSAGRFRDGGGSRAPRDHRPQLFRPARSLRRRLRSGRRQRPQPAGAAPRADRDAGAFSGLSRLWHGGRRAVPEAGSRRGEEDRPARRPLGDRLAASIGCASRAAPSPASSN